MPKKLNLNLNKFLIADNTCPKLYWRIFSFKHLENFNDFIESTSKLLSNDTKYKNYSVNTTTKCSIKLEQKLFKFFFLGKIFPFNTKNNTMTQKQVLQNYTIIMKKRMVINCSKFLEICYKREINSKSFSKMNQIIFYYLINFYDISNRKMYQYFNIHIILYYIMNKNYDESFKRFVISRLLVNMDLLKYSHFIIMLDEIFKNMEIFENSTNLINLFHPFNPMKLNQTVLENFFKNIPQKKSEVELHSFSAIDLILTVNLSKKFPIKQKIILLENLIQKLNENCLKSLTTIELLNFIKSLKIVESNYFDFDFYSVKNTSSDSKFLVQSLKMKSELKLKFGFSKAHMEYYYSNIPFFLNLIREIAICGKYIEDKEIFEDFFNLIRKSSLIHKDLNSVINSLFEIFIELHPQFIFKLFIQDWSEKIFRDENLGRITKNVLKCVLYFSLKSEVNSAVDSEIENIRILKDFVKNFVFCKNDFQMRFDSVDDLIEICFYMILVNEMNLIELEDGKVFEQFLKSQIEVISQFLYGTRKISLDEEFVKEILCEISYKESKKIKEEVNCNFFLLKNKKDSLNFIYLISKYIEEQYSKKKFDSTNFSKISVLSNEVINYVEREFFERSCTDSYFDREINQELRMIVRYLNKNFSKSDFQKIRLEEDLFYFSEFFEYTNRYCTIRYENNSDIDNRLFISFRLNYTNSIKKELKEIFIEKYIKLLFEKNKINSKIITIDMREWITLKKEQKINLIKTNL